jgi:hypothetical protein
MVKIKSITNENLMQYQSELQGNIILSIDNVKAANVETVSKLLSKKDEGQSVRPVGQPAGYRGRREGAWHRAGRPHRLLYSSHAG